MPEIDGLRFIAILSVLLIHILGQTMNRSAGGHAQAEEHVLFLSEMELLSRGVQLFFVISGFILAQPFLRQFVDGGKPVALGKFYLRRITRLEPPYLLSMVLYAASFILFRHEPVAIIFKSFVASVFYLGRIIPNLRILNFVTWSLEVEVEFYLLTPLLAYIFAVRPVAFRRAIILAVIAVSAMTNWEHLIGHNFLLPANLAFFFVGFLLADLRVAMRPDRMHPAWDLATLVIWPLFFFLPDFHFVSVIMCALLLTGFTAAMFGPLTRRALGWRPIAILGGACYSIYLLHMLIISALFPLTRHAMVFHDLIENYVVELLLLLPSILVASMLYFVAVERPCMEPNWPQHLWRRLTKQPQAPVQ